MEGKVFFPIYSWASWSQLVMKTEEKHFIHRVSKVSRRGIAKALL